MKRTAVIKIILDLAFALLFALLLFPMTTGLPFHELFGLVSGLLLSAHLLLNRQWICQCFRCPKTDRPAKRHRRCLNAAMGLTFALMLVTGVLISAVLFPGHTPFHRPLLVTVHRFSAWATAGLMLLHLLLHRQYLQAMSRKLLASRKTRAVRQVLAGTLGLCLIAALLYQQVSAITDPLTLPAQAANSTTIENPTEPSGTTDSEQITAAPEAEVPSVDDYLSSLYCTGCSRHCPLIAPRCSRGQAQQEEAMAAYTALYIDR